MTQIDWDALLGAAIEAMTHAYCPYSHFPVGAAGLASDGRIVSGCNVENAGYGVTLCAECGLISELVRGGGGKLLAFVCVNADAETIVPCGRCRQLLAEHADPAMVLDLPGGLMPMAEALPFAFGPGDLNAVERTAPFESKEN